MRIVKELLRKIMIAEIALGALLVISMVAVMVAEVVMRYLFNNSIIWVQEFVIFLFIWITALGANAALMMKSHITINTFSQFLPERLRSVLSVFVSLVILGVLVYLVTTLPASIVIQNKTRTSSMPVVIPKGYYYSFPFFVSVLIMIATQVYYLYYEIRALAGVPNPEDYIITMPSFGKRKSGEEARA
jgi:TRAP-type C4-dicarboxylate transport system permease small subunit